MKTTRKVDIIRELKKLMRHEAKVGGDYDILYFGLKRLLSFEKIQRGKK